MRTSLVFSMKYGDCVDEIKFAAAFCEEASHVSYVSRQMGFRGLSNPGLPEMHWIWHMSHCQLNVWKRRHQTMGGKPTRGGEEKERERRKMWGSFKPQTEAQAMRRIRIKLRCVKLVCTRHCSPRCQIKRYNLDPVIETAGTNTELCQLASDM